MSLTKVEKFKEHIDPLYELGYRTFVPELWKLTGLCNYSSEEDKPVINNAFLLPFGSYISHKGMVHPDEWDDLELAEVFRVKAVSEKTFPWGNKIHLEYTQGTNNSRLIKLFTKATGE